MDLVAVAGPVGVASSDVEEVFRVPGTAQEHVPGTLAVEPLGMLRINHDPARRRAPRRRRRAQPRQEGGGPGRPAGRGAEGRGCIRSCVPDRVPWPPRRMVESSGYSSRSSPLHIQPRVGDEPRRAHGTRIRRRPWRLRRGRLGSSPCRRRSRGCRTAITPTALRIGEAHPRDRAVGTRTTSGALVTSVQPPEDDSGPASPGDASFNDGSADFLGSPRVAASVGVVAARPPKPGADIQIAVAVAVHVRDDRFVATESGDAPPASRLDDCASRGPPTATLSDLALRGHRARDGDTRGSARRRPVHCPGIPPAGFDASGLRLSALSGIPLHVNSRFSSGFRGAGEFLCPREPPREWHQCEATTGSPVFLAIGRSNVSFRKTQLQKELV